MERLSRWFETILDDASLRDAFTQYWQAPSLGFAEQPVVLVREVCRA
jgi:hypothetical protein